ncbi:MAG: hypothetical protein WC752_02960 [Patescibacteria group bacterium]|jgi:hypothetical protein
MSEKDLMRMHGHNMSEQREGMRTNISLIQQTVSESDIKYFFERTPTEQLSLASVPTADAVKVAGILRKSMDLPPDSECVYTELPGGKFVFSVEYGLEPYREGKRPKRAGFFNKAEKAFGVFSGSGRFFTKKEFDELVDTLKFIGVGINEE